MPRVVRELRAPRGVFVDSVVRGCKCFLPFEATMAKKKTARSTARGQSPPKKKAARRSQRTLKVDTIEAGAISIVDETGKARIRLSCWAGGDRVPSHAALTLLDGAGRPSISLDAYDKHGTHLTLWNRDGSIAMSLGVNHRVASTGLSINESDGFPAIRIGIEPPGDPADPAPRARITMINNDRYWMAPNAGGETGPVTRVPDKPKRSRTRPLASPPPEE